MFALSDIAARELEAARNNLGAKPATLAGMAARYRRAGYTAADFAQAALAAFNSPRIVRRRKPREPR